MKFSQELLSNAESVISLAEHIGTLKRRALLLKHEIGARKRGYFTPTEEEKLRQLAISYWQTRAALFDIMLSVRFTLKRWFAAKEEKYALFMVGYAATIILVDAARFLYENYDDSKVIREKLNEPDKQFGIPAGIYDQVQQSLNNPINAWQIEQANRFYKKHKKGFAQLAHSNKTFAQIHELIDTLEESIHIVKPEYVKTTLLIRLRQVLNWFTKSAINRAVYSMQEGVSRMVSKIKTKPHKPHLPKKIQKQLKAILQPGDVLVTRKEFALTNYFLPGYWPHAALYMGDDRVLESLKDGVHIRSIETPFTCDAITVIRPKIDWNIIKSAINRGLIHEGKEYDFDFDFTQSKRLVCTAVVYRSYEGMGDIKFELKKRAGRMTLSAEDLLELSLKREFFEPVAVYCPLKKKKLLYNKDVDKVLKATIGKKV